MELTVLTGTFNVSTYQSYAFIVCCLIRIKVSMPWSVHVAVEKWLIILPFNREYMWRVVAFRLLKATSWLSLTKATLGRCKNTTQNFLPLSGSSLSQFSAVFKVRWAQNIHSWTQHLSLWTQHSHATCFIHSEPKHRIEFIEYKHRIESILHSF